MSRALSEWWEKKGILLRWIQPGQPTPNAYIEPLNGTFRPDSLDGYLCPSMGQVSQVVDQWLLEYNTMRPHQAVGFVTPLEFKQTD
jgi:putative transposase